MRPNSCALCVVVSATSLSSDALFHWKTMPSGTKGSERLGGYADEPGAACWKIEGRKASTAIEIPLTDVFASFSVQNCEG